MTPPDTSPDDDLPLLTDIVTPGVTPPSPPSPASALSPALLDELTTDLQREIAWQIEESLDSAMRAALPQVTATLKESMCAHISVRVPEIVEAALATQKVASIE